MGSEILRVNDDLPDTAVLRGIGTLVLDIESDCIQTEFDDGCRVLFVATTYLWDIRHHIESHLLKLSADKARAFLICSVYDEKMHESHPMVSSLGQMDFTRFSQSLSESFNIKTIEVIYFAMNIIPLLR